MEQKFENQSQSQLMQDMLGVVQPLLDNREELKKAIFSTRGKRKGLVKTGKPKEPVYAYIWRMARFYSGDDCTMPVMESFDFSFYMRDVLKNPAISLIKCEELKIIFDMLDDCAIFLLKSEGIPMRDLSCKM